MDHKKEAARCFLWSRRNEVRSTGADRSPVDPVNDLYRLFGGFPGDLPFFSWFGSRPLLKELLFTWQDVHMGLDQCCDLSHIVIKS